MGARVIAFSSCSLALGRLSTESGSVTELRLHGQTRQTSVRYNIHRLSIVSVGRSNVFTCIPSACRYLGAYVRIDGRREIGVFGRICYRQMQSLFGDAGASTVQTLLSSSAHMGKSRVAIYIGVVTLLIGASTVFVEPLKLARLGLGTRVPTAARPSP
jgi:hypothetical protein